MLARARAPLIFDYHCKIWQETFQKLQFKLCSDLNFSLLYPRFMGFICSKDSKTLSTQCLKKSLKLSQIFIFSNLKGDFFAHFQTLCRKIQCSLTHHWFLKPTVIRNKYIRYIIIIIVHHTIIESRPLKPAVQ